MPFMRKYYHVMSPNTEGQIQVSLNVKKLKSSVYKGELSSKP